MFENNEVVFGTVIACSEQNTLTIDLDSGERGKVSADEIGRREYKTTPNFSWMVRRRLGFLSDGFDGEGFRILSARAYENRQYEQIVRAFRSRERNVYTARYSSTTKDGKLAFYTLAQGVNASLTVTDFAYTRIANFNEIVLPRELTVAVKDVDSQGRLRLYAKIAFGDFASSVDRLALEPGSVAEGFVSGTIPANGDAVVTLAPNLTVLTARADVGSWVKVKFSRIDYEDQRLKGEIIERSDPDSRRFRFSDWCVDASNYPAYVDIDEFERRIGPRDREPQNTAPARAADVQISYETTATTSPFALREGETGVRSELSGGTANRIVYEFQHGYLGQDHMLAAKAVNELRFTTSWQIQRYLHLKHGLVFSDNAIRSILNRLIQHDIIHTLRFCRDDHCSVQQILYPGATLYQAFTGAPRSLPSWVYSTDPDVAYIKCCLSANQLMLGVLHGWSSVSAVESRVYISTPKGLRIRPRHKVTLEDGSVVYLESARSNWLDGMLEKLARYNAYLAETDEPARVLVTLETESDIAHFAQRVERLHLDYDVLLTCDLQCLPAPVTHTVPASGPSVKGGSFLSRLRSLFR